MKLDRQLYEAANRLRAPEFAPLVQHLRDERAQVLETLSAAKLDNLQVLQGRSQELKRILDLIDDAHKVLEKKEGLLARFL
jgi:hypothetical protein